MILSGFGARRSNTRNTWLNLAGLGFPLMIGVAVMPVITHNLGPTRLGLLGLTLALLEYSGLFDLGLGRATTKHVAERLARGDSEVSHLVVGSVLSQTVFGSLGGFLFALSAPFLTSSVFMIPEAMRWEAIAVFQVLGAMIPATLLMLSLRGVLEAAHRFDLSNAIRIPGSLASFLVPAVAASRGDSLPAIMMMLLITRLLVCCVMVVAVKRAIPTLRWRFPDDWSMLKPLLAFGGWMSISNVVSPLLIYLDRFMLGAFVGLAAVGFYTAPFDGVIRMLIVPGSLVNALFPSISGMHATDDRIALNRLFSKAVRNMSLVLAGPALVLMLFGPTLLRIWLGETFAQQGGLALRILAFGVFLNSLAHVPSSFVAALGRPDISAKFHMVELVLHVPLAWWLIRHFGVPGAATAWAFRVTVDAVLLFAAMSRLLDTPIHSLFSARGGAAPMPATAQDSC
ncbi:MAG: flippase [Gemmatimonadaceae bacterium]|nr:flippase [Gemmatimonadaceae bacterium]